MRGILSVRVTYGPDKVVCEALSKSLRGTSFVHSRAESPITTEGKGGIKSAARLALGQLLEKPV